MALGRFRDSLVRQSGEVEGVDLDRKSSESIAELPGLSRGLGGALGNEQIVVECLVAKLSRWRVGLRSHERTMEVFVSQGGKNILRVELLGLFNDLRRFEVLRGRRAAVVR